MGQNYHSLVLLNDGTVKGFGSNYYGQLGLGNNTDSTTPTLIPSLSNVKQISCGVNYTLVLLNDGTVKGFGHNAYGQLGLGNTTTTISTPTLIPSLSNVKQIACGGYYSLVLLNDGTVKGFGLNSNGQLGLGNVDTPKSTPVLIPSLTNVKQISCGNNFSLALLNDGTVKAFGYNVQGELGLGNVTSPYMSPTLISSLTNVNQIVCGNNFSLALLNDGTVKGFGQNSNGQLGLGNVDTPKSTPVLIPSLSNIVLLWDNIVLLVILRKRFVMFVTDTKSAYGIK